MKKALLLVFSFISSFLFSQVQLGMSSSFTVAPSFTVSYGTVVTAQGWIKNKGSVTFSSTLTAYADTIGHVSPPGLLSTQSYSIPVTILPGDSILTTQQFTVTPALFKTGGGGTTVVVWPKSSAIIANDSLKFKIFVESTIGIREEDKIVLYMYPNPCHDRLYIKEPPDMEITNVVIYDVNHAEVMISSHGASIDVSELCAGVYSIFINTKKRTYRSLFIKE